MPYSVNDLRGAVNAGVIGAADLDRLLAFLSNALPAASGEASPPARFDVAHLLWYAGALIVIDAPWGCFRPLAFSQMGGQALTVSGGHLCDRVYRGRSLPLAPQEPARPRRLAGRRRGFDGAARGLRHPGCSSAWWGQFGKPGTVQDFYVWIKGSWIFMEIADHCGRRAGAALLSRAPFIVMLIAVALWFMSMDLAPWVAAAITPTSRCAARCRSGSGLAILLAWTVDCRSRSGDFAFWLHLFGLITFWGGISQRERFDRTGQGALLRAECRPARVGGAVSMPRASMQCSARSALRSISAISPNKVFKDSLLFPFALSLIGIAVIAAGLLYHRNERAIADWLSAHLPASLLQFRSAAA